MALAKAINAPDSDAQSGTLLVFHLRFAHLSYDKVERILGDPESVIRFTDKKRPACVTCGHGKQRRNKHSQKDTGMNAPIDRVGGVICSDIKGPITLTDRLRNRYMYNFIDSKSNYCRVFLAKTKDKETMQFEQFLAYFEKHFN